MKKKILLALASTVIAVMLFALVANADTVRQTWDVSKTSNDNVTAYLYNDAEYGSGYYYLVFAGEGEMKDFSATNPWSYYLTSITKVIVEEGVTSIGADALYYQCGLRSVSLPSTLKSIGNRAFYSSPNLTRVELPKGLTEIGMQAFSYCTNLTIYAEAESQPSTWDSEWNDSNCPVVWGYFDEEGCLSDIYTFKGYSFNEMGGFAVGFEIDYDALAKYEEKTGKTLEIGVVFAGFENLGGKQPLDENGEAITLDKGMVVKADITEFGFKYYDFILSDISDEIKDVKLVIAGYIFDGEAVKYVQASGMSDTVVGVTYNEAKGE